MISKELINEVKNRLVKVYDPLEIYLFGSYAWGNPTEDSDLDLLIVIEKSDEKRYKRSVRGYISLAGLSVPNDIIVYTSEEFDKLSKDITRLSYKIKNEGEVIYAKS